jgi:hypothetical protein
MIGDDDFFMQNSDYHYGASDAEKMYGRDYNNYSGHIGGYDSSSSGRYESSSKSTSSENDIDVGKYCIIGLAIAIAILLIATIIVPAVIESMANSVTIEDLNITRYNHSSQYDSKVYTDIGYEVTYNQKSYGDHVTNLIFYSKKGKVLHNDSEYIGEHHLEDVPYYVDLDEKADYAVFEVYRNNKYGKCIYRERVDVDNKNVKKEFINYDSMY